MLGEIADPKGKYGSYRQHCYAPGLPFLDPYIQGPRPDRKRQDFFRFHEYVEWRKQGNYDDLANYVTQDLSEMTDSECSYSDVGTCFSDLPGAGDDRASSRSDPPDQLLAIESSMDGPGAWKNRSMSSLIYNKTGLAGLHGRVASWRLQTVRNKRSLPNLPDPQINAAGDEDLSVGQESLRSEPVPRPLSSSRKPDLLGIVGETQPHLGNTILGYVLHLEQ